MGISERVQKLRQQSLDAVPSISAERAELLTAYYQQERRLLSEPVRRAEAFHYLLANKKISIQPGELIVGEKGPAAGFAPTFPELCCHSLEDLDILDSRPKTSFKVSAQDRQIYEEKVIPYWKGRTIRETLFAEMTPEWMAAYEAGIFTEFMEQRSPGHTVLDGKIYQRGFLDFEQDIQNALAKLDYLHDPDAYARQEELKGMLICCEAIIHFAKRYAAQAKSLALQESDPQRKQELEQMASICSWVPAHAPRNFWEALQAYWFVHLGVTIELNTWDSFNPGRLDQHLYPFYKQGIEEGKLTRELAEELLQCFWIKFNNQPAPPKVGVTAEESGTYTDFAQINMGGLKEDGTDGCNPVSFLLLDVVEEMRLLQPSASVQVSKKNPDKLVRRAAKIIRTGFGQPSLFNADLIAQELVRQGKSISDARNGGSSGCVEVGAFGKENYNLTGYLNLPKILEITLNNGVDPRTGKHIGLETGNAVQFTTYDDLFAAFEKQLDYFVDIKVRGNQVIERLYARYMPSPFLSVLINDCIQKGKDYHDGGARYNTSYIQGVGLGSLTDAMTAIKFHVFEQKTFSMPELLDALKRNYTGSETLRKTLLSRTPKYGNDDDRADQEMVSLFNTYFRSVDGRKNTRGGEYHINMLPTTVHIYFGSVTGAMPDGRRAGEPLSEGVSPVQGADFNGPTAVLKSVSKMDHVRTGGTLLNQKFSPQALEKEEDLDQLVALIRTYFRLDGHHVQFNVVDVKTLRAAKQDPEHYRSLIVRVAGYSDYFCSLSETLQDEIIARTEHQSIC